jgi:phage antirepressor YoqD-like protein
MTHLVSTSGIPLAVTPIDGEPRIHDLALAVRLGFDRPRKIRDIIKRNEAKLLNFGGCPTVGRLVEGNETKEYYLNQKQSIFICMKSETDRAFDVQVEIVRVFDAHLTGGPIAVLPRDYPSALRALADESERRALVERELEASRPKIAFHDQVVRAEGSIDFTEAFSLLQGRTGQNFTRKTFLEFLRFHGVACQPNAYANIGRDKFVPRHAYTGTWFVSEMSQTGATEWRLRPLAISAIVSLIEEDRMRPPMPLRNALVSTARGAA